MIRVITCVAMMAFLTCGISPVSAEEEASNYRFLYNSDGENLFNLHRPPMNPNRIGHDIQKIAEAEVTTFLFCPNVGMRMNFPSQITRRFDEDTDSLNVTRMNRDGRTYFGVIYRAMRNTLSIMKKDLDPCGLVIEAAKRNGMETFITFRMNEVQGAHAPKGYPEAMIMSKFWSDHPEYRVGSPEEGLPEFYKEILGPELNDRPHYTWLPEALNYAIPEVREHRFAQIKEILERYDVDGLELDFQNFPIYFKHGEASNHLDTMTEFVQRVKELTDAASKKQGHPVLLTARVMAHPEQSEKLGLDVDRWARDGLIDFIAISHHHRRGAPLAIAEYRAILPDGFPLYASLVYEEEKEAYRDLASHAKEEGADGIYLYNFFESRNQGRRIDFDLAREIGTPFKSTDKVAAGK